MHGLDIPNTTSGSSSSPAHPEARKRLGSEAFSDDAAVQPHSLSSTVLGARLTADISPSHDCGSGSVQAVTPLEVSNDAEGHALISNIGGNLLESENNSGSSSSDETVTDATISHSSDSSSKSDVVTVEELAPLTFQGAPSYGTDAEQVPSAAEELAAIASRHNLTHASINDILDFCRRRGISDLPKDARTVMCTERKAQLDQSGSFVHFGLLEGIRQALGPGNLPQEVKLQANIDGVPLFKSSQTSFWPILCRLTNVPSAPFVVSVYCGGGKPPNLERYLAPFLEELVGLVSNGLVFKGSHIGVTLTAVVCDAPARSFVKAVTGHTGYHSCEMCTQKGHYMEGRVTFPRLHAPVRTNESFRAQEDKRHHTGLSPFLSLDIDMVKCFPTEYMHLVCLGVMRRMLRNWVSRGQGSKSCRLGRFERCKLNDSLRQCAKAFPSCFQRKPRGTEELDRWKATEFRTFLLYVGPVVLKSVLPTSYYKHFLVLHVAVTILASPQYHLSHNQFARDLLRYFVQEFGKLYGQKQLVYNVHTLSHLAEQCLEHGPLDDFSAFPFESHLGKMKKLLRSSNKPLAQLSRRLSEMRHLAPSTQNQRPRKLKAGDCFLLDDGPVVVLEVTQSNFKAAALRNPRSFYKVPLQSSVLCIWKCDAASGIVRTLPLAELCGKTQCLKLTLRQKFVVFPLLHLH